MLNESKVEMDYNQIRNDVAAGWASGLLSLVNAKKKPRVVRVSADRLAACRRISAALLIDESLSILSACVAEGLSRHSYVYVRDNGLL